VYQRVTPHSGRDRRREILRPVAIGESSACIRASSTTSLHRAGPTTHSPIGLPSVTQTSGKQTANWRSLEETRLRRGSVSGGRVARRTSHAGHAARLSWSVRCDIPTCRLNDARVGMCPSIVLGGTVSTACSKLTGCPSAAKVLVIATRAIR